MYKIILLAIVLFQGSILAQTGKVGINTNTPQRTLDINGSVRVRTLANQSENANYDKVLIADQNGNVDHLLRSDFLPLSDEFTSNKMVINNLYSNTANTGIEAKIITCGDFKFRFGNTGGSNSEPRIEFGLNATPPSTVNVYVTMEQNWNGNGFQLFQGNTGGNTTPFSFSNTNFTTFAQANLADYEQNVIHFQYPGKKDFYRLTIYKLPYKITINGTESTKYDFISNCEKF